MEEHDHLPANVRMVITTVFANEDELSSSPGRHVYLQSDQTPPIEATMKENITITIENDLTPPLPSSPPPPHLHPSISHIRGPPLIHRHRIPKFHLQWANFSQDDTNHVHNKKNH